MTIPMLKLSWRPTRGPTWLSDQHFNKVLRQYLDQRRLPTQIYSTWGLIIGPKEVKAHIKA